MDGNAAPAVFVRRQSVHALWRSRNSNKETTTHTDGLLVASGKSVVVSRFEEPAETVFAVRPEHEVSRQLSRDEVGHSPVLPEVDPFGPHAKHELCLSCVRDVVLA